MVNTFSLSGPSCSKVNNNNNNFIDFIFYMKISVGKTVNTMTNETK